MISLHRFYFDTLVRARRSGERYGQAMFNHLVDIRPDLAEMVRGTPKDPFHCTSPAEPVFDAFIEWLEKAWFTTKEP